MSSLYAKQSETNPVRIEKAECEITDSGMKMRWKPRAEEIVSPDLFERVLAARGLGCEAEAFLAPSLRTLHDPTLIPDLERSTIRILRAIEERETIVIFGDYDVDGVTASAILIHTIRAIDPGARVRSYIPHRVEEGYGLNEDAIRALHAEGTSLIVSVDCGITAIEPALVARSVGIDLIITDHHNPPTSLDDMPEAYAVVHPRRPDSEYPFGELCGAGVAFKLAWNLCVVHSQSERVLPHLREGGGGRGGVGCPWFHRGCCAAR